MSRAQLSSGNLFSAAYIVIAEVQARPHAPAVGPNAAVALKNAQVRLRRIEVETGALPVVQVFDADTHGLEPRLFI